MIALKLGTSPKRIGSGKWEQISGGMQHVCGITTSGKAFCLGEGYHGQLGNGKRSDCLDRKNPCEVSGGLKWSEIAAGEYNTCGLTKSGDAYCWGEDTYGKNGNGKAGGFYSSPTAVIGGITFETN